MHKFVNKIVYNLCLENKLKNIKANFEFRGFIIKSCAWRVFFTARVRWMLFG